MCSGCDPGCAECSRTANIAAAASVAYTEARDQLRSVCRYALEDGMDLPDLQRATGRDEEFITTLLREDEL